MRKPTNAGLWYTDEEKALVSSDLPVKKIARMLKKTPSSIRSVRSRIAKSGIFYPPEVINNALKSYKTTFKPGIYKDAKITAKTPSTTTISLKRESFENAKEIRFNGTEVTIKY